MRNAIRGSLLVVLGLVAVAGIGLRAGAQDERQETDQQRQMGMQCPMMATLKSVQLHADAPPVLLAQEEQLELTAEQKEQLREIAAMARQRAREVLSEEQREKLEAAPSKPLSPMQLARMLGQDRQMRGGEGRDGQMCPMCMRMMQQQNEQDQADEPAQREDAAETP